MLGMLVWGSCGQNCRLLDLRIKAFGPSPSRLRVSGPNIPKVHGMQAPVTRVNALPA